MRGRSIPGTRSSVSFTSPGSTDFSPSCLFGTRVSCFVWTSYTNRGPTSSMTILLGVVDKETIGVHSVNLRFTRLSNLKKLRVLSGDGNTSRDGLTDYTPFIDKLFVMNGYSRTQHFGLGHFHFSPVTQIVLGTVELYKCIGTTRFLRLN